MPLVICQILAYFQAHRIQYMHSKHVFCAFLFCNKFTFLEKMCINFKKITDISATEKCICEI